MAARVSTCVANAHCRARRASEARSETIPAWGELVPEIPSWPAIVEAIRERATDADCDTAQDLNEWADFLEACEQLRRQEPFYQKKS